MQDRERPLTSAFKCRGLAPNCRGPWLRPRESKRKKCTDSMWKKHTHKRPTNDPQTRSKSAISRVDNSPRCSDAAAAKRNPAKNIADKCSYEWAPRILQHYPRSFDDVRAEKACADVILRESKSGRYASEHAAAQARKLYETGTYADSEHTWRREVRLTFGERRAATNAANARDKRKRSLRLPVDIPRRRFRLVRTHLKQLRLYRANGKCPNKTDPQGRESSPARHKERQ
jgi:hypothetical protein